MLSRQMRLQFLLVHRTCDTNGVNRLFITRPQPGHGQVRVPLNWLQLSWSVISICLICET